MNAEISTVFHVVLDGRTVGPYDRRTIVGMRIKKALTNEHVLIAGNGDQITVGELMARRSKGPSGFGVSRNPYSTHLLPTYPVRFARAAFGFRGEGEARLQPDILRIEGDRRSFGFFTKRARVKVPLNCVRDAELQDTTVSFSLSPEAPFAPAVLRSRVVLVLESQDMARELFSFLPERNAEQAATPADASAAAAKEPAAVQPRVRTPAALALAGVNLAVFAALAVLGGNALMVDASTLAQAGAHFSPLTRDGQAWRLVTGLFFAAGAVPLFVSLLGLLVLGRAAERAMGTARFLGTYVAGGVFGGLASLWWSPWGQSGGATVPLAGTAAAFAVFALFPANGAGLRALKGQWLPLAVLAVYWAAYGRFAEGVDHAGHLGAVVMGALMGLAVSRRAKWWPEAWRFAVIVGVAVFAVGAGMTLWMQAPNRGPAWRADAIFLREAGQLAQEQVARTEQSSRLRLQERGGSRDRAAREQLAAGLRENQNFWRATEEKLRAQRLPVDARTARAHAAMLSNAACQQELVTLAIEGVTYGDTAELERRMGQAQAQARDAAERLKWEFAALERLRR